MNIPLKDGKTINIPVDHLTFDPVTNNVNITNEISSTQLYKQLEVNDSNPELSKYDFINNIINMHVMLN